LKKHGNENPEKLKATSTGGLHLAQCPTAKRSRAENSPEANTWIMKVNTLVRKSGMNRIGVICRVLKRSVEVRWDQEHFEKVKPESLERVNVAGCRTISFTDFKRQTMLNTVKENRVILGNELKEYVGIGWLTNRLINEEDLLSFPRVVDDNFHSAQELNLVD
jgi:hypothetical protein